MREFQNTIIVSKKKENDQVSSFQIYPVPDSFLQQKPAQYLLIRLPRGTSWTEAHPFTIAGEEADDFLTITVKKIGNFTTALHSASLPQAVQISGPFGDFAKSIDTKDSLVYIAGGIGITPFLSLLRHQAKTKFQAKITLFWANNKPEEYFDLGSLKQFQSQLDLKLLLVAGDLSGDFGMDPSILQLRRGLLTADVLNECTELKTAKILMCGSENMQRFVFAQLGLLGVSSQDVETERIGVYMRSENHAGEQKIHS